jgi:hypothetical protein
MKSTFRSNLSSRRTPLVTAQQPTASIDPISNFESFTAANQDLIYTKLSHKLMKYMSFKLIQIFKIAEEVGLCIETGSMTLN